MLPTERSEMTREEFIYRTCGDQIVFVCSPYSGEVDKNVIVSRQICQLAFDCNCHPFAPHLIYPDILDDSNDEDRKKGIDSGIAIMSLCSVIFQLDVELTRGMKEEILVANDRNIYVEKINPEWLNI